MGFGSSAATPLGATRWVPTAPGPSGINGAPPPPAGASSDASAGVLSAAQAAARQRKLAAAGQPLIGGPGALVPPSPIASLQAKTLVGY